MTFNTEEFQKLEAKGIVQYFEQSVLAPYHDQPEKYRIETDYFAGKLTTTAEYYRVLEASNKTSEYIDVRFGYRTLATGELALAVWMPDLVERSKTNIARWSGFILAQPLWAETDERFSSWVRRYIQGDWNVESGPGYYLHEAVHTINALTLEGVGMPLFIHEFDKGPEFPSAANTHRYEDAHKHLYGYLIDGISKDAIRELARRLRRNSKLDSMKTRAALEATFPALKTAAAFQQAYDLVSKARRNATHGVRAAAVKYSAFEQFTDDLKTCVSGLKELIQILSAELALDPENAVARVDAKKYLPKIESPPAPQYSINKALDMVGRTVERVEFGTRQSIQGTHQSEVLTIYFTDGSILGIDTGSNAGDIESDHQTVNASDFHVDFILQWVPPKVT